MPTDGPDERADGAWIEDALARHEAALVQYARRLLGGDVDGARDVVQEAFLRLCRTRREDVEDRVAEWLCTVVRNLAVDARRKDGRMTTLGDDHVQRSDPAARRAGEAIDTRDEAAHVLRRLEELPDKQREALVLKFQHGLSYKEIGRVMGESVGNVGWLIHVGIKGLRGRLAAEGAEA